MNVLDNIKAEDRIDRVRQLEIGQDVIAGPLSGDWEEKNDNAPHYDLACSIAYMRDQLKLSMPVGMLAHSVDSKPFNANWLMLNGELISQAAYPQLYDYLRKIGYAINAQGLVQLPDARGLVFRSQNRSRFSNVDEIALGGYQADATQKVGGGVSNIFFVSVSATSGAFFHSLTSQNLNAGTGGDMRAGPISFDNSRVARTALEERVKALGVNAQIFVGFQ